MKKLFANVRPAFRRVFAAVDLRDVFVFGGLAAVGYGIAQIHVPAAWIATGSVLFLLGLRR